MVARHFAWFHRGTGAWLAEWAGEVPAPTIPVTAVGDLRHRLLNRWQQTIAAQLADYPMVDALVHTDRWAACGAGEAVCLDVTPFQWPVGDHLWHVWDDAARALDWGPSHLFLEAETDTGRILANTASHRPIRAPEGRMILDITGTPLAAQHGHLFGTLADWSLTPALCESWDAALLRAVPDARQIVKELYGETHQS